MGLSCFKAQPEPDGGTVPGEFETISATLPPTEADAAKTFKKKPEVKVPPSSPRTRPGHGEATAGQTPTNAAATSSPTLSEPPKAPADVDGEVGKVMRERRAGSAAAAALAMGSRPELHEASSTTYQPAFNPGVKQGIEAQFQLEAGDNEDDVVEAFDADTWVNRTGERPSDKT